MKFNETTLLTWFERSYCHVHLVDKKTEQKTIMEFRDEEFYEAIEAGFLSGNLQNLHRDVYRYAVDLKIIKEN